MEILDCHDRCVQHYWFAAVILVIFRIYKHFETLRADFAHTNREFYETIDKRIDKRIDDVEVRVAIWREEELEDKLDTLQNHDRRIHSGLTLNGGFVERESPTTQAVLSYNIMSEINAGNYLGRKSLEAVQDTEGWYEGRRVMVEAPLNRTFRRGSREVAIRSEYKDAGCRQYRCVVDSMSKLRT